LQLLPQLCAVAQDTGWQIGALRRLESRAAPAAAGKEGHALCCAAAELAEQLQPSLAGL